MTRTTPPADVLEQSRLEAGAGPEHIWSWCSNDACSEILWFHPSMAEPFERKGATFKPVCSPECAATAGKLVT